MRQSGKIRVVSRLLIVACSLSVLAVAVLAQQPPGATQPRTSTTPSAAANEPQQVVIEREPLLLKPAETYHVPLKLVPAKSVDMAARFNGVVNAILIKRGEVARSQAEVIRLDAQERQLEMDRAKAAYQAAKLEQESAEQGTAREIATAKLDVAKADLDLAEFRLNQCNLRAPFDGVIQEVHAVEGEFIQTGQPLATLVDVPAGPGGEDPATAALWRDKGLRVEAQVPEGCPPGWGDADRLSQVLVNLFSNAIKFTAEGRITAEVRVHEDVLRFTVRDTGKGIAPDDLGGVFEFAGDGHEGLAQKEDAEAGSDVGQGDGEDRVDEAKGADGLVILDDQDVGHDQQLQQHQGEEQAAPGEAVAHEGIGRQRAEQELAGQDQRHQQEGVEEIAGEGGGAPGLGEVFERQGREEVEIGLERRGVKGGPDGEGQRQEPEQRQRPGGKDGGGAIEAHL